MEYYSAIKRNRFEGAELRWMYLEPVTQSEVSQKQKNKYHILPHIYGIHRNGTHEPICRAGTERQTVDLWTQQKKRVG